VCVNEAWQQKLLRTQHTQQCGIYAMCLQDSSICTEHGTVHLVGNEQQLDPMLAACSYSTPDFTWVTIGCQQNQQQ
jgi:hypothetical protein